MARSIKKKKKLPFTYIILAWILAIISLILIGSIIYLNILNTLLLIIVIGAILTITSFSALLMLKSRKKKVGFVISIALVLIYSILSIYINKTTGFLSDLDLDYKTYNYSVVVLKDGSYNKLKDLNDGKIGYYDDGSVEMDKALNKVLSKIELEPTGYEDNHTLADALFKGEENAILIENSYLDILNESITNESGAFKDQIKDIYKFVITTKTSDIAKDINVTKEPFSVYVSGIDTYGEISSVSRSDVNMVVTVNPATQQILLTSIPRDYYVQLHGKSGYKDKLTHAGLYGTDMSIQTIEDLLNTEINYYVKVNFSSVINIVNAIDGVTVYSDYTFTSIDNYRYKKGYNEVRGEEALSFSRERKAFPTGDRQRIKNQQALLRAIFDKCTSKAIITKYTSLLDSMSGSFVTNMKMSRLTSLVRMQLSNNYTWNLVTNSLNGSDASNYTYSAPKQKAYVMEPDEESVAYASELIKKVLEGEKLDEETMAEVSADVHKVTKGNTSNSSSSETKNTYKEETTFKDDTSTREGLKAKLAKTSFSFVEGDEYIYHGYSITYDGKTVTDKNNIKEAFSIEDKVYDNYRDLVSYVSKLSKGEYQIKYTITYKEETVFLTQKVTVEALEIPTNDKEETTASQNKENQDNEKEDKESTNTNSKEDLKEEKVEEE